MGETTEMNNQWDWRRYVPMWDWHSLAMIGWPGWEREPGGKEPLRIDLSFTVGEGKSSHAVAAEFDDLAVAACYYRDFTENGSPFVRSGDTYRSAFWFSSRVDMERFESTYCRAALSAARTPPTEDTTR